MHTHSRAVEIGSNSRGARGGLPLLARRTIGSALNLWHSLMILPPASMDLGLLMISIGVVNLWRAARQGT